MRLTPPPEDRPLTARERVERRRAQKRAASSGYGRRGAQRRRGCGPAGLLLLLVTLGVGALLLGLLGWARGTLRSLERDDPRPAVATSGAEPAGLPEGLREPFNVLLIGVDRRADLLEGVRSDTLILVHVNPPGGWAGMLSIPRDSVVNVPYLGQQKINTAYSYGFNNAEALYGPGTAPEAGGGALAAETVEGFLGLRVDYTAQIDFRGFERVVDTLGGITVDVPLPLLDSAYPSEDYGYERIFIPAGLQVLDGPTALRYARSRHSTSDFDRSRRQQQVLRAILAEVRARGLLSQAALLPDLARDLQASVNTTLPLSDIETIRGLADLAQRLSPERITQLSINPNDVGVLGESGSDIYWDQGDVRALVGRLLAGPDTTAEAARVLVLNGAGVQGLAGRVTSRLAGQGFVMEAAGDAPAPAEHSLLIDYSGRPQTLQALAEWLGLDAEQVLSAPPPGAPAPAGADIVLVLGADYQPHWAGE